MQHVRMGLWVAIAACLGTGCVHRIPLSVGGERRVLAGQKVSFGQAMEIPALAKVDWSMGDGNTLSGTPVAYAWDAPGNYEVCLQITDEDGQRRQESARVVVLAPAIRDVVPLQATGLLLFDQPGKRLNAVPLFLERLLPSGQEANAALSWLRENLGFDPFSPQGLVDVGLDPGGGIAWVIMSQNSDNTGVLVATLAPGDRAIETLRRLVGQGKKVTEDPDPSNSSITILYDEQKKPMVSWTVHRGHLWVELTGSHPEMLRQTRAEARTLVPDGWSRIWAARGNTGAASLFLTKQAWEKKGQLERGKEQGDSWSSKLLGRMDFLRMDLEFGENKALLDGRLGLSGPEPAMLARALRARNQVPLLGGLIGDGSHLILKSSVALPLLLQGVLDLSGQGSTWEQMMQGLDQFKAATGISMREGVLDNLGDSALLSIRFNPEKLLKIVSGQAPQNIPPAEMMEALWLFQLRDPALFSQSLEKLKAVPAVSAALSADSGRGPATWRLGVPPWIFTLAQQGEFALLGTTAQAVLSARARISQPHPPSTDWQKAMESPDRQMAILEVRQLLEDLKKVEPARDDFAAALFKPMLQTAAEKLTSVSTLVLDAVLHESELTFSLSLNLRSGLPNCSQEAPCSFNQKTPAGLK